jgi:hypothetical protein
MYIGMVVVVECMEFILPFIHAFAHPYQLRLKKGRVPLRDGSQPHCHMVRRQRDAGEKKLPDWICGCRHSPLALPYIAGISVDGQDSGRSCHRIGALAGRLPHAPAPRRFEWRSHRDGQVIPSRARRLSPGRRRRSCCRTSPPRTEKSTGTPPSPPGNKAAESSRCCSPISICFAMRLYWILHLDAVF